jgi:RTX calcium-binding nonapeptide repeat (4 copies)
MLFFLCLTKERRSLLMRRTILLMATMALTLLVASGVALAATVNCISGTACTGTKNADIMNGTADADSMFGRAGADLMRGNEGEDYLQGDRGADALGGDEGQDTLWGGSLLGSGSLDDSDDVVHGGIESDYIYSGFAQNGSVDHVFGDRGNDTVEAEKAYGYPKTKDIVDCGPGENDTVYFDKGLDVVKNCEHRHPDQTPPPTT